MQIEPMTAHEWPWILGRSVATGWQQLTPEQQAATTPALLTGRVQAMLVQALSTPGATVLVAREQGEPIGYLVVAMVPDELTGKATGLFLDIWVEPHYRGRGVAGQLTAAGEAYLRAQGLRLVRRVIAAHNLPSLRHALRDGCRIERHVLVKPL